MPIVITPLNKSQFGLHQFEYITLHQFEYITTNLIDILYMHEIIEIRKPQKNLQL